MTKKLQNEEVEDTYYPDEKSKYIAVLEEAAENDIFIHTHNDFQKYYAEKFNTKEPLQSTVSENFHKFGIEKNQDGNYEYFEPTADKTLAQQYILSTCCGKISKISDNTSNMFFFRVRVNIGSEQTVCKLISDTYNETRYWAIIPCYGSVVVICAKESNAKSIRKFIYDNKCYDFDTEQE